MKKFMLLAVIAFLSLTAFSQTDTTAKSKRDSSVVVLPAHIAKEVAKDLIRYDSAVSELQIEKSKNELLLINSNTKDSLIASKDSTIEEYKLRDSSFTGLMFKQDQQMKVYKDGYDTVKKSYIKEKKVNKVYQIIITILATTNLICLVSKH